MIYLVLSGKMVFFFFFYSKIYFFFGWKMKDTQKIHGNMIFYVYMYKCYKYDITLLQKEIKGNLLPRRFSDVFRGYRNMTLD